HADAHAARALPRAELPRLVRHRPGDRRQAAHEDGADTHGGQLGAARGGRGARARERRRAAQGGRSVTRPAMTVTEVIEWHRVADGELPDDGETVMLDYEDAEPWPGWHEGD